MPRWPFAGLVAVAAFAAGAGARAQMELKPIALLDPEAARTTCPSFAKGADAAQGQAPEIETCAPIRLDTFGVHGGETYWYGLYCIALRDHPAGPLPGECRDVAQRRRGDGVAVMVAREGKLVVIFADASLEPVGQGSVYEAPKLAINRFGAVLDIPILPPGTAAPNGSVAFLWERGAWRALDTTSWLATFGAKLPKGMVVRRGIWPDYARLAAETPLWQARDALCCPSGGTAEIAFVIRARALVVDKVTVKPAPPRK